MTKPGRFFSRHTETRATDRIQFVNFELFEIFFTFLGFHGVVGTREDHSIDVSITNVGLFWWDAGKVASPNGPEQPLSKA